MLFAFDNVVSYRMYRLNDVREHLYVNESQSVHKLKRECGTTLVLEVAGTSHGHAVLNETNKSTRWCFDCMFGSR